MLPPTGVFAPGDEGGHDGVGGVESRGEVRDCDADFHGGAVARPGDVHQTHLRFDHDVVACAGAVGACLAVAGDGGVDQGGVDGGEGGVVEVVFGEGLGEVVLHEDVAGAGEGVQDGLAGGVGEGEAEGVFVAVDLCLEGDRD